MIYIQWLLLYIPSAIIELAGYFGLNLIAPLFITKRERTDRVKRIHPTEPVTIQREYLQKWVYWFQTHDNAVDEYWWDKYNEDSIYPYIRNMTRERYYNSKFARYAMRVMWLYRNNMYGFLYNLFSKPDRRGDTYNEWSHGVEKVSRFWWVLRKYDKSGFQFEGHIPILPIIFGYNVYQNINIGWKAHRSAERCMYANRILFGIRIRRD